MLTQFDVYLRPGNRVVIRPEGYAGRVTIETPEDSPPCVRVQQTESGEEEVFLLPHVQVVTYPDDPDADEVVTQLDDDGYLILEDESDV